MDDKFFLKSNGVVGGLLAILGALGVLNPTEISSLQDSSSQTIAAVVALVGGIQAVVGRVRASKGVRFTP